MTNNLSPIKRFTKSARKNASRIFISGQNKFISIGLTGVILALGCGAGFYSIALPWKGTSDSIFHLDYAWQLSHGDLPNFNEGLKVPIPTKPKPVQFVSQHPPLYYALIAPVVGPLIDSGHWKEATLFARLFTILISIMTALALAWAGWVFGGRRKKLFAVALPAVATSFVPFVKVAGDTYNDMLAILSATLALVICTLLIRNGPKYIYIAGLALVSAVGMASRFSFVSILIVMAFALTVSIFIHYQASYIRRLFKIAVLYSLMIIPAIVCIGWFYFRNYKLSGYPHRVSSQNWVAELQGRPYKSLTDVLTDSKFLFLIPNNLYGNTVLTLPIEKIAAFFILISTSLATFIYWLKSGIAKIPRVQYFIFFMLLLQMVLVVGEQIVHSTGYGSYNLRYLLTAILPIGLVITSGALVWSKLRSWGVVSIVATGWLMAVATSIWTVAAHTENDIISGWQQLVFQVTEKNNLPFVLIPILLSGILLGVILEAFALHRLYKAGATIKKI